MAALDTHTTATHDAPRPAEICARLLAAMEGSEGRRQRRKRDTTPDAIGLAIKRDLLERAVAADPLPDAFEDWLLEQCLAAPAGAGSLRAMAGEVLHEWRIAESSDSFRRWLAEGAPSDDAGPSTGPAPHAGDTLPIGIEKDRA